VAAVLTLTSPFTPMLFMGEEFAASTPWQFFTSHPEPELGKATAEGRIREFERMGWDPAVVPDPQDPETFRRSKLNWAEAETGDHARLLSLYRSLTALRREYTDLAGLGFAETDVTFDDDAGWLRFRRGRVEVLLNFSSEPVRLENVGGTVLLSTDDAAQPEGRSLSLPAWSAAIVQF
jgi:maltooligosyltrehalose trehalohydrolase